MTGIAAAPLTQLLRPGSIAVVGASVRSKLARRALRYLREFGFPGEIVGVNPKYQDVDGVACYPSLADVPNPVDLVVVMVPATQVVSTIEACAEAGAGAAVVLSSGFAEAGPAGRDLQDRLRAAARSAGVRVLGPNCQGLVYAPARLYSTFTAALADAIPQPSGLAYVGQSGALGGSFMSLAAARGFGLSAWVTTGNQLDLTVTDIAEVLADDPAIQVMALYFEALPDGAAWSRIARRAREFGKHLVVLRSGRSADGRRAAASHTGAMIRHDRAFDLVSAEHGVSCVADFGELLNVSTALLSTRRGDTRRVGVVTTSGAAGALAVDHLESCGLTAAVLADTTADALRGLLPAFGSIANPVDVTAAIIDRADRFGEVCIAVLDDPQVDALLVVLTAVDGAAATEVARSVAAAARATGRRVLVSWLFGAEPIRAARDVLRAAHVPCFESLTEPIRLLAALQAVQAVRTAAVPSAPAAAPALPPGVVFTEVSGSTILDALGIVRPESVLVGDAEAAARAALRMAGRVVLKVQSPDIAHKSEVGGVRVARSADDAAHAYIEIVRTVTAARPDAALDGVLVQRHVDPGVELLVAVQGARDGYPPLVTVGFGGTTAELYADIATLTAPVTDREAIQMLRRLRGWPLLAGFRGGPPADVAATARVVAALSVFACQLDERLHELEINPLIVGQPGQGAVAADLLVHLRDAQERQV